MTWIHENLHGGCRKLPMVASLLLSNFVCDITNNNWIEQVVLLTDVSYIILLLLDNCAGRVGFSALDANDSS